MKYIGSKEDILQDFSYHFDLLTNLLAQVLCVTYLSGNSHGIDSQSTKKPPLKIISYSLMTLNFTSNFLFSITLIEQSVCHLAFLFISLITNIRTAML